MWRRLLQLYVGLALYGVSTAMFVRSNLGTDPWNVFHLGLARLLSLNIGVVIIGVGVLVLLLWVPLRQKPGLGTISNVIMIGLAADAALAVLPAPSSLAVRSGAAGWRPWWSTRSQLACYMARASARARATA